MTFLQRLSSLARADAHGVLDALEDRSLALRQCLREAELAVARKRVRIEELDAALEHHERQRDGLLQREAALDEDVRLALQRSEDELARYAIRRLLAARQHRAQLTERTEELQAERAKLAQTLEEQEREFETLREEVRLALEAERARTTATPAAGDAGPGAGVRDEEVELELLRRLSGPSTGEAPSR